MAANSTLDLSVVLGAGPVGRAVVEHLVAAGHPVKVATRSGSASVASGVEVVRADVSNVDDAKSVCDGAAVVYGCVGLDYSDWPARWPPMMAGMLAGAESAAARFVFTDNCYMYGPVDADMHEDMPLTNYGRKPATRSRITRMWQDAHVEGRVEAAAVRASDFYGPGVTQAALGERSLGRIVVGKSAQVVGDPSMPHSFTYVPDIARALTTVANSDDAMGQAWNVPNAPTQNLAEILERFAEIVGKPLKIQAMPTFLLTALGLVNSDLREMKEMLYQWERPFRVDASKFERHFWSDATSFDDGLAATAAAYA